MFRVVNSPSYSPTSPLSLPSVTDAAPPDYNQLEMIVKKGEEILGMGQDVYPNRNIKPRGSALIINYEKFTNAPARIGSEKDVICLDQLLPQLGYNVTLRTNLSQVVFACCVTNYNLIIYWSFEYFLLLPGNIPSTEFICKER